VLAAQEYVIAAVLIVEDRIKARCRAIDRIASLGARQRAAPARGCVLAGRVGCPSLS
jgi:hypothetical protein